VRFEISDEAAALIRSRGGRLWIWPDLKRRPYAASWPPAFHETAWTDYAPDGLVVHVDSAIVPPKRWVLSTVASERWVVARWDGLDPQIFGRLPLDRPEDEREEEPLEHPSSPLAHIRRFLVVPALAWVFAILWALRFFGVSSGWLSAGRAALIAVLSALALVATFVVWVREKRAERREGKLSRRSSNAAASSAAAELQMSRVKNSSPLTSPFSTNPRRRATASDLTFSGSISSVATA
jgi:hypothetical protein